MRIVDARETTVSLEGGVANAVVRFADHTVSLVALISDQQRDGQTVVGYGFNSIGRYGQAGILGERLFPRLLSAAPDSLVSECGSRLDPARIARLVMQNEKPGGHGDRAGAVGALELAVWDLNAKLEDEPAYATIARQFDRSVDAGKVPVRGVPVYAAGGYYYPDDSLSRLGKELETYQALGFNAFKIKIGGANLTEDLRRIEAALQIADTGAQLAVDANGRFNLQEASAYARAMEPFGLRWYEEPGDPLDLQLNSELTRRYAGPIATGENLFSTADTLNLVRYGGMRPAMDVFQMDPGLSYGITEYADMLDTLEQHGFSRRQCFPHGGHLPNLHIVAGLGLGGCEAYPGVFQPFGGYSPQCRIEAGLVWPSDAPGFGLEQKPELQIHLEAMK